MSSLHPRALIVVESRHGATLGIAGALAQRLVFHDFQVQVVDPTGDAEIDADIILIGSAIYLGKWLKPAIRYLEGHAGQLADLPVWLFSSGPLGDDVAHGGDGVDGMDASYIDHLIERVGARDHRVFAGRLDRGSLGPVETLVAHAVHAPEGDFRNWLEVYEWADEIASEVGPQLAPG
jgi:menaquinone-dependent protoporphyrinogen oxidase